MPKLDPALADTKQDANGADQRLIGVVLADKYRLIEKIGSGGMGDVWKAERLGWDSHVAVKLMSSDAVESASARTRFAAEGRLAAKVRSRHLVQVLDDGVDPGTGRAFLAMELLEGQTLADRLLDGPMTFHQTRQLVGDVASALEVAHSVGVVHRDLKPTNIFLCREQGSERVIAKVLDLGAAKLVGRDVADASLTREGSYIGTIYYSSPEQLRGLGDVSPLTDLWALAAVASECLTARRAFSADSLSELASIICGEKGPRRPSTHGTVPHGFDEWFAKATRPNANERFKTLKGFRKALEACENAVALTAPESSTPVLPKISGDTTEPSVQPLPIVPMPEESIGSMGRFRKLTTVAVLVAVSVLGGASFLYKGSTQREELQVSIAPLQAALPTESRVQVPPAEPPPPPVLPTIAAKNLSESKLELEPSDEASTQGTSRATKPGLATEAAAPMRAKGESNSSVVPPPVRRKRKPRKTSSTRRRKHRAATSSAKNSPPKNVKRDQETLPTAPPLAAKVSTDPDHPLFDTVFRSVLTPTKAKDSTQ